MEQEAVKAGQASNLEGNAKALRNEMQWLAKVLETRLNLYFGRETPYKSIYDIPVPDLDENPSVYANFVKHFRMSVEERLLVLIALAPHVAPQILDCFYIKNEQNGRIFTEFGGVAGREHRGFIPTGETVAYVLAGNDLTRRFMVLRMLDEDHYLIKQQIILLEKESTREPELAGNLTIGKEFLTYLTTGAVYRPRFSSEFPAQRIKTNLDWDDLVLEHEIRERLNEILRWITKQQVILQDWGLSRVLKRGYRALFYGPPGTGKTLTASLLGKTTELDVYRIDISKLVSKYIGETEKNLANIFDQAENKNWILFFDEADALFGKRTNTSDSKDRYANQEVAYLLQRIEDFPGVVLLATNLKSNIDVAFIRRFQSLVYFPMPGPEQRYRLWKNTFKGVPVDDDVDWRNVAKDYELSGGTIINVLRFCALSAIAREEPIVYYDDIVEGIRNELRKEGKTV